MTMVAKVLFFTTMLMTAAAYPQNYGEVDQKVKSYPHFNSLTALGYRIQNDFIEDSLKVRAAFIWLTHNMKYGKLKEAELEGTHKITFDSETDRLSKIRHLVNVKITRSFNARKGVCIDYSLMLHELCRQFGIPSKVIAGVAKTEIKDIRGDQIFKNHSWNAVQIRGQWKLMDPTWASGHFDLERGQFERQLLEHYFFTEPSEFVKHHLPSNPIWQLLDQPLDARSFYAAPIYFPDYFDKGIELSTKTLGILYASNGEANYIYFDKLPRIHAMQYSFNGSSELKKMGFKKIDNKSYRSRIRLNRSLKKNHNFLTVYMEDQPILNFKIENDRNN
ncbi:MAG: hypothetical protein E4H26_01335 [Flavobacteriales bacterium]|nr:MAG: hypothetical protein E4H26_01335 [Flavobacteriales bacterium]